MKKLKLFVFTALLIPLLASAQLNPFQCNLIHITRILGCNGLFDNVMVYQSSTNFGYPEYSITEHTHGYSVTGGFPSPDDNYYYDDPTPGYHAQSTYGATFLGGHFAIARFTTLSTSGSFTGISFKRIAVSLSCSAEINDAPDTPLCTSNPLDSMSASDKFMHQRQLETVGRGDSGVTGTFQGGQADNSSEPSDIQAVPVIAEFENCHMILQPGDILASQYAEYEVDPEAVGNTTLVFVDGVAFDASDTVAINDALNATPE